MQQISVQPHGSRDVVTVIWFSPRETQLLQALCSRGSSNKEIAARLDLSESTVRNYVSDLCRALKVGSRVELVLWALAHPECLRDGVTDARGHEPGCVCDGLLCRAQREAGVVGPYELAGAADPSTASVPQAA